MIRASFLCTPTQLRAALLTIVVVHVLTWQLYFHNRCLTGPFQSDALVVPHKCQFDHIHDKDQCKNFDYWADVASKSCTDLHQMDTNSFAMLLPCGTDMFTGVEFVCCPKGVYQTSSL